MGGSTRETRPFQVPVRSFQLSSRRKMGRRSSEQHGPVYCGELEIHSIGMDGRPGRDGETFRAMWQGSAFSALLALHKFGHLPALLSARSWHPHWLWVAHMWGTGPFIKDTSKEDLAYIAFGTIKSWGENDCFLPQHEFYYTRFHYNSVVVLGVCLLHKQCSYSSLHHLSNQDLKGSFIY